MKELFKIDNIPVVYREHLIEENLRIIEDMIKILNNHSKKLDDAKVNNLLAIESIRLAKLYNWIFTVVDSKALYKINKIKNSDIKTDGDKFLLNSYKYLEYLTKLSIKDKINLCDIVNLHRSYNNKQVKLRKFGKSGVNLLCDYKYNVKTDLNIKKKLDKYISDINNLEINNDILYNIIYSWLIMYIQPFKESNIILAYSNLWAVLNSKLDKSIVMLFKSMIEYSFTLSNEIENCEKLDKNYRLKQIDITMYINTMLYVIIKSLSEYNESFGKDMITSMSKDDFLTRVRLSDKISYTEMIYGLTSGKLSKSEFGVEIVPENRDTNGIMIEYVII